MKFSDIIRDLENANPQIFKDTFLIRKMPNPNEGLFYPKSMVLSYMPDGPKVVVGYASPSSPPWNPAVIIDIIDGV